MLIDMFKGKHRIDGFAFAIIIATVAGGYTVSDYPEYVLNFFKTPIGQFVVFFPVLFLMFKDDKKVSVLDIALESIIIVFILQILKYVFNKFK